MCLCELNEKEYWIRSLCRSYGPSRGVGLIGCGGFLNRRYSLLSFGRPQLYNSEALPFTYGQFVVIELADKFYNSITVWFFPSQKYVFHIGLKQEPNVD